MSALNILHAKLKSLNECKRQIELWKNNGEIIVFTNGCFDLLHQGHLDYLARAKDLGSKLVIGLNSDASVKRLKGTSRPINDEISRAKMLSALFFVDAVVLFEEDTPLELIENLSPNILVKGGDYTKSTIIGAEFVESKGGKVEVLSFIDGFSTTNIVTRIQNLGLK